MSNNDAENKLPPEPARFHFSIASGKWSEAYVTVKDYERLKEFCLSLMKPRPKAIRWYNKDGVQYVEFDDGSICVGEDGYTWGAMSKHD